MLRQNMARHKSASMNIFRQLLNGSLIILTLGLSVNCEAKSVEDAKQHIRVKNFQGAVLVLDELSQKGDAEAQYMLAVMHRNGHGVDRNLAQAFNWFFKSAQNNHVKAQYEVGMCYKNGLGVQKDSAQARLWLTKASKQGYAQASEQLLLLSETPELHDNSGDNFLHAQHAVEAKDNKVLSQLIDHININQTDAQGNTLLHTSSQYKNYEAAKFLLKMGIDRNLRNKNGNTALAVAINEDNLDISRLLLEKSHVNDRFEADATAAILAARSGNDEIIRQLSKMGADLSLKDKSGLNALDYAEKRNHPSTKTLLVSLGVKSSRPQAVDVSTMPVERTRTRQHHRNVRTASFRIVR